MSDTIDSRSLLRRHSARVTGSLLLSLTASGAGVALLGVAGWFLTGAALTTAALSFNLFGPSALVRGLSFLRIGARYGERIAGHDLTLRILADLREALVRRLIPRVPLRHGGFRHADLVSRLVADVDSLDAVFVGAVVPGLTALAIGVLLGGLLAALLPPALPAFALGFGLAALAVPAALVAATRTGARDLVGCKARLRSLVLDDIAGHTDLVVFGRCPEAQARAATEAERLAQATHRLNRASAVASAGVGLLAGGTVLAVLALGLGAVGAGGIGGPTLVGLVFAVLATFEAAALLVRGAGRLGAAWAARDRLEALASAPPLTRDPRQPRPLPSGADLRFEAVTFAYRSERMVLRGLDLDCPAGSRTAIIGASGCGKSTLLSLSLRLVVPASGTIRVAGIDIAGLAATELHGRVALLGQDSPVFLGTIRHNLLLGRPEASEAELWHALGAARLSGFVRDLPEGLDTWCGEGGRSLSLGQARRLCLARILLTRAEILLLDEPTSGLDPETERAFFATLIEATAGRTVLMATHAALPRGAVDRVLRLEDGRLVPASG